jgi:AcrR family transcriptional regulator
MTEKQENILKAGLELFAAEGFHATSTSKVAKKAGVSEALIFRHFESKEGLLKAILQEGNQKAQALFSEIIAQPDPREQIRKILTLPFEIDPKDYEMWRLIYALKWQTQQYQAAEMEPLRQTLVNSFTHLNYENPAAEAEIILMFMDGAATALLLHEPPYKYDILKALIDKYNL